MSRFTIHQKEALLRLSRLYSLAVHVIVNRGGAEEIFIRSSEEGKILDGFADKVCTLVGHDADIHADALMGTGMISKVLAEYQSTR